MNRETEYALAGAFRVGKGAGGITKRRASGLQMQRSGIVNGGFDFALGEKLHEAVAFGDINGELVEDRLVAGIVGEQIQREFWKGFEEAPAVESGEFAALAGPVIEAAQLNSEDGSLDAFHPVVVADHFVIVAAGGAVSAGYAGEAVDGFVVGDDRAAFAVGADILRGIEAEDGGIAETADAPAAVFGAVRLGGVFEDSDSARRGDFTDGVHISRPAVKMDGQNGASAEGDGGLDEADVQVGGGRVDVHEDRARATVEDCFDGGKESVGRSDDFVAGLDAEGEQAKMEGGGARVQADAESRAAVGGEFALEGLDFFAEDVGARAADTVNGFEDFVAQGGVFGFEVEERDFHGVICGYYFTPFRRVLQN